jgi:hypothetical protein
VREAPDPNDATNPGTNANVLFGNSGKSEKLEDNCHARMIDIPYRAHNAVRMINIPYRAHNAVRMINIPHRAHNAVRMIDICLIGRIMR